VLPSSHGQNSKTRSSSFDPAQERNFIWIPRNPLKSTESDEENQENPRKSKLHFLGFPWIGLDWLGKNLAAAGPRRRLGSPCPR
jgi:hypothetical protein